MTADSGDDASTLYSDPDYPGLVWSVPYLDYAPEHAFVVDEGGTAVGFVVGAADTAAYEQRLEDDWWPKMRVQYAGRRPVASLDSKVLDYISEPEHSDAALLARFPAHLHINLLAHVRSGGWGKRLIEAELGSLRKAGAAGVHLGVSATNPHAIGFYRHMGFVEIEREPGGILFGIAF